MNYYFSDKNYLKDDFIKGLEAKDPERCKFFVSSVKL